jgi:DHA1 family bicyclomycin/chloramphenicol resistance-like MFS transporter
VADVTSRGLTLVLGALTAFGPLSIDMYLPALPALADSFGASPGRVQLTLSAFFLGFGAGQLVYGPLADRWGRRPPLLAGIGLYIGASALCALSTSVAWLIALRLVQGLGACAGPLITRAVVRDLYERDRAARMLSLMMLVMGAAPLLAPLLGGQLLRAFGWRSIFAALAVFGVLCFLTAGLFLRETLGEARRSRAGVPAMVARYGALLADRAYLGYTVSSGAAYAGMFAYFAGSPFVFIRLHGVAAEHYGFLFALNVIGLMACAAVNSRLVPRHGAARLLRHGVAAVALAGGCLLLAAATGWGGLAGLVIPLLVFIASLSFVGANALASALVAFPHMAGTASALAGTIQFGFGAASGAAVSVLHDGTALPMAAVIAAAGLTSLAVHRLLVGNAG